MASLIVKEALIVFLKKPVRGNVKTRIGKVLGHDKAVLVYNELLQKTAEVVNTIEIDVFLYVDEFFDVSFFEHKNMRPQKEGDLGFKMLHAFQEVFDQGYDKVGIIGSDCLELTKKTVEDCFLKLDASTVVFGPSIDGGYYFLGMNHLVLDLFKDIPWSTSEVLEKSVSKLADSKVSFDFAKKLSDVDTVDELLRYPILQKALSNL